MSDTSSGGPDDDRTVIRPAPGGRRSNAPVAPDAGQGAVEPADCPISNSPLIAAASPLLQLLPALHNQAAADLHERVVREIKAFERRVRQAAIPEEIFRPAHFALCASIDDVVLNTPRGAASDWNNRTLVSIFYHQAADGEKFFDTLARLRRDPQRFLPAIEVMYLCLSLGFMGHYRPPRGDTGGFNHLRAEICALIVAQRRIVDAPLSPRWKGVHAPYRPARRSVPVWVVVAAATAICGGFFVWVSVDVNAASDRVYARFLRAPPDHVPRLNRVAFTPPPAPPAPGPGALDRLTATLKAEITAGKLVLAGTASMPVIRISDRTLFPAANASLLPSALPLLDRIGFALKSEPGAVEVIGYTDSQPIRSVRFPSNFQLSQARARAAAAAIGRALDDPDRVAADGRADADPIGSNETADGRDENRRIEIVLRPRHQQD